MWANALWARLLLALLVLGTAATTAFAAMGTIWCNADVVGSGLNYCQDWGNGYSLDVRFVDQQTEAICRRGNPFPDAGCRTDTTDYNVRYVEWKKEGSNCSGATICLYASGQRPVGDAKYIKCPTGDYYPPG